MQKRAPSTTKGYEHALAVPLHVAIQPCDAVPGYFRWAVYEWGKVIRHSGVTVRSARDARRECEAAVWLAIRATAAAEKRTCH
jgi:hypothetical protein